MRIIAKEAKRLSKSTSDALDPLFVLIHKAAAAGKCSVEWTGELSEDDLDWLHENDYEVWGPQKRYVNTAYLIIWEHAQL